MNVVIIAGGNGSRLWPISRSDFPKHLLKVIGKNSLLQETVERATLITDPSNIYIVSEKSHSNHIHDHAAGVPVKNIIVEPERRGTASCVLAALAHIKRNSHNLAAPIIFMHADHYIKDSQSFVNLIKVCAQASSDNKSIVLLGINPTYPATGFGYIKKNGKALLNNVYKVIHFKEKPAAVVAETYLAEGDYLWNMGYFIANLDVFEANIKTFSPELWKNYGKLLESRTQQEHDEFYRHFENTAIDTSLIERVPNLLVATGDFEWADVGSYKDLHKIHEKDAQNNSIHGF